MASPSRDPLEPDIKYPEAKIEPPKPLTKSVDLNIDISNLQPSYKSGDVISGVVQCSPTVLSLLDHEHSFTLTVTLHGRTSTHVTLNFPEARHVTKSDICAWEPEFVDVQELHNGPRQSSGQQTSWPFTFTVPEITAPTFYSGKGDVGRNRYRNNLFHEYLLEASLTRPVAPKMRVKFWKRGEAFEDKTITVIYPQLFRGLADPIEIIHYPVLREACMAAVIWSLRVNNDGPGSRKRDRSLPQHLHSLFLRSRLPRFNFSLVVDYPVMVQQMNPLPVHFKIGIVPLDNFGAPPENAGSLLYPAAPPGYPGAPLNGPAAPLDHPAAPLDDQAAPPDNSGDQPPESSGKALDTISEAPPDNSEASPDKSEAPLPVASSGAPSGTSGAPVNTVGASLDTTGPLVDISIPPLENSGTSPNTSDATLTSVQASPASPVEEALPEEAVPLLETPNPAIKLHSMKISLKEASDHFGAAIPHRRIMDTKGDWHKVISKTYTWNDPPRIDPEGEGVQNGVFDIGSDPMLSQDIDTKISCPSFESEHARRRYQ